MKPEDEYWFWITAAISEPILSDIAHFYDLESRILFSVNKNYPNRLVYRDGKCISNIVRNNFFMEIDKFLDKSQHLVEIPKIPFQERLRFLSEFVHSLNDDILQSILQSELDKYSLSSKFKFEFNIRGYDKKIAYHFHDSIEIFLTYTSQNYCEPLGITENTYLLW